MRYKARGGALFAALLLSVTLVACSSNTASTPSSSGGSTDISFATTAANAAYASTDTAPPTTGPAAVKGKKIWYISCGQLAIGCSAPAAAAQEAAQAIGWDFTLYDGAFNDQNKYSTGIQQALAAGANGIILGGVDCSAVQPALEQAKAAGVMVVAFEAFDCDDPSVGGAALFSAPAALTSPTSTWKDFIQSWGALKADWIISNSNGTAQVINLMHEGHLLGDYLNDGFTTEMAKCAGCSIVATVPILDADLTSPGLGTKTSAAILAHPTANYIEAPYDSFLPLGVDAAVTQSGQAGKISVIGGEGYAANLDLIRSGGTQTAAAAWSVSWAEWSLADTLNRLFAGQAPATAGVGFTLIDKDHNLPASGADFEKVDYRQAYKAIWGN